MAFIDCFRQVATSKIETVFVSWIKPTIDMAAKQPLSIIPENILVNKIHQIRGIKVMLDRDLAELYGVETRVLKQATRRNLDRFPQDFMFELTSEELNDWRSQIVTSNSDEMGLRYKPFVFTEHGILLLSSILNNCQAIQVNIQIVRIFTRLRQWLTENGELKYDIEELKREMNSQDKNIELLFTYLDRLMDKKIGPRKRMGFMPDDL